MATLRRHQWHAHVGVVLCLTCGASAAAGRGRCPGPSRAGRSLRRAVAARASTRHQPRTSRRKVAVPPDEGREERLRAEAARMGSITNAARALRVGHRTARALREPRGLHPREKRALAQEAAAGGAP